MPSWQPPPLVCNSPRIKYAAHWFFSSSFTIGSLARTVKIHSSKRSVTRFDAAVPRGRERAAESEPSHQTRDSSEQQRMFIRSVGKIPSLKTLGEFWRNKAQCSVMVTSVFISYHNHQHLATAVLTCWKRKSLPCLYGELTGGLTLQEKKEFSNMTFM